MAAPTGTKFYTYQPPGKNVPNVKPSTPLANNQLKLKPGQTTGYQAASYNPVTKAQVTPGGYYAKPAPPKPGLGFTLPGGTFPIGGGAGAGAGAGAGGGATQAQTPWDHDKAIAESWELAGAQGEADLMNANAKAAFQKQLRQAYIDYGGGDTTKLGDYAQYIDAATIEAAKNNKFSQMAQNLQGFNKANRQSRARLAGLGMLSSGETTSQAETIQGAREQADYGGMRQFMGGADQGFNQLNSIAQQARDRIAAARQAAADRTYQNAPLDTATDAGGVTTPGSTAGSSVSKPPAAFGGITGTRQLANGGTVTTYANGRQVQKMPGKPAYVIKQGN